MQTVGPYTLLGSLGRCDVGGVWTAVDASGRRFTLAVLDAAAANDQGWRDAFAATAYALSQARADKLPLVHADYTAPAPWVACAEEPGRPGAAQIFLALGLQVRPVGAGPDPAPTPGEEPTAVIATTAAPAAPEGDDGRTAAAHPAPRPEPAEEEHSAPTPVHHPTQPSPVAGETTELTTVNPRPAAEATQEVGPRPRAATEFTHPAPDRSTPDTARAARPWDPPYTPVSGAPHDPVSQPPHTPVSGAPHDPASQPPHTPVTEAPYPPSFGMSHGTGGEAAHGPPRVPVFGTTDVPVSGAPQPISAMPTSPFGYFPAEPSTRPGAGRWLVVAIAVFALALGVGGGAAITSLASGDDDPARRVTAPTPTPVPSDIGLPSTAPSQPGVEPPQGGGWPEQFAKFKSTDQTEEMNNLEGLGFSFRVPPGWECRQTARGDGYAKYACGIGTEIGGDVIVRHCERPCTSDRRRQLRAVEEAFGVRWTRSGPFAAWAEANQVNGAPRYGLVYVGFWRSMPEDALDRQLVIRMTSPTAQADDLRKVVNSIRDVTFTL